MKRIFGVLGVCVLALGCGTSAAPATVHGDVQITLAGVQFRPGTVTIRAGQSVEWVWQSGRHDVTSGTGCMPDGKFASGDPKSDGNFVHKFDAAGEYPFYCTPHCASAGMTGKVIVTP